MAEIILTPLADLIIDVLASAAVKKIGAVYRVKHDLEELEETLSTIRAVLLDAESQQVHNNQVKLWLERLADVVNDADDLVDRVNAEGLLRGLTSKPGRSKALQKKVSVFFSSSNQLVFRRKLSGEIIRVRKRLDKICTDRRDFKLEEIPRPATIGRFRETHSFVVENNVFGRFEDKQRVLEMVLEENDSFKEERVSVVSIFGMGGLGKTTLAQLVFNDESFQKRFDEKIWVCVSEDFDVKVILGKAMRSLTGTSARVDDSTTEELQKTLRERLRGKRYLLVLDDVWNENHELWLDLMDILSSCGESGSRIIVTTRSESVAKLAASDVLRACRLGILSDEDSWSLFKKIAFEPTESDIEQIGKEIVKKCGGVPLAIKMIASVMSVRDPKTEWATFLKKELSSVLQQQNDILPTLKLSYDALPSHLKRCFAYCRLFPKDYEIHVETLINLWIAQGFIGVEEIGYDHFLELLGRCFFQEAKMDEIMNKVVTCKMHDLVHDLAIEVAGKEFVFLSDPSQEKYINEKTRHVSICSGIIPSSLLGARRLRSLLRLNNAHFRFSESTLTNVVSKFDFLRILGLQNLDMETVPKSIGKMRHLRYLDLSENKIKSLPTSITKLVNLQTLKLNNCRYLFELPRNMKKLISLRHLEFNNWANHHVISLPRGVRQLTNLQTLSYFLLSEDPAVASRSCKLDELMGLNNLRGKLDIDGLRPRIESSNANLKEKEHLRLLRLKWSDLDNYDASMSSDEEHEETLEGLKPHPNLRKLVVDGYAGVSFSSWLSSLTNLVELRLERCLKLKRLSSLESLCSLTKMCISYCSELEYIIIDVVRGDYSSVLPSLQQLELNTLHNFRGWQIPNTTENAHQEFSTPYFPCLASLKIWYCPKLTALPLYPNVKDLKLEITNRKPFEQTILMSIARPQISSVALLSNSLSSTFYPLSEVRVLCLYCPSETSVKCLPVWMQSLSSVKTLELLGYIMPQYVSQFYKNTMQWEIKGDGEHETLELALNETDSIEFESLTSLHKVVFEKLKDLVSLPEWLRRITSVQILKVSNCHDLRSIPDWICELSLLQELHIEYCSKMESFPGSISSLTCLHTLKISSCSFPFEEFGDPIKWGALTSLRTLKLGELPTLVSLPEGLQCATSLQSLELERCFNLTAIPDWISGICSLQELVIRDCPKIESLPGSISSLTSLQELTISDCPVLSMRCTKETGEDWPKIKHIPTVIIG